MQRDTVTPQASALPRAQSRGLWQDSLMHAASRPTFNPLLFASHRPVFKAAL